MRSIRELEDRVEEIREATKQRQPLLFRGQQDASWPANTTLDRTPGAPKTFIGYYLALRRIRSELETFSGFNWSDIPQEPKLRELFRDSDEAGTRFGTRFPAYDFLVYLRHNGFPSPLLDWSRSLYVAAYFASSGSGGKDFAVFVFSDMPSNMKVGGPSIPGITRLGNNTLGHRRHFLQQSEYTVCSMYTHGEWKFASHDSVFRPVTSKATPEQDALWKFVLPGSERATVLGKLQDINLTAYSLFGSEESLMQTLAIREFVAPKSVRTRQER